jgi:hypothetical protein
LIVDAPSCLAYRQRYVPSTWKYKYFGIDSHEFVDRQIKLFVHYRLPLCRRMSETAFKDGLVRLKRLRQQQSISSAGLPYSRIIHMTPKSNEYQGNRHGSFKEHGRRTDNSTSYLTNLSKPRSPKRRRQVRVVETISKGVADTVAGGIVVSGSIVVGGMVVSGSTVVGG